MLASSFSFELLAFIMMKLSTEDIFENESERPHIVNVERNGKILYIWKGRHRYTNFGLYDPNTQQNKFNATSMFSFVENPSLTVNTKLLTHTTTEQLLYTYEKDVLIVSCSVNNEMTLLAFSYLDAEGVPNQQRSGSKYITLLLEIHPVNDMRVLKATERYVRVQFLYPAEDNNLWPESHLLLISEDGYIELCKICLSAKERCKVVPVAEEIIWAQWDMLEQRLYIIPKEKTRSLQCIQFYPNKRFSLELDVLLDIPLRATELRLVNFGYDHYQNHPSESETFNLQVFTSKLGHLCMCYSHTPKLEKATYSAVFFHKGYSKTFTADVNRTDWLHGSDIHFLNLGVYIAVFLPGHFLHLLNMQHPHLMCYNFFLAGEDAKINGLHCKYGCIQSLLNAGVFDYISGTMFTACINQSSVLSLLQKSKWDCDRLASLHCILLHFEDVTSWKEQIICWICDNVPMCHTFDPIQEFIIASLYRKISQDTSHLHKMLPYSSVPHWKGSIPGVACRTDIIALPMLMIKTPNGHWAKLQSNLEYTKVDSEYNLRRDWCTLISEGKTNEKRPTVYQQSIVQSVKSVLSTLETWNTEPQMVPQFVEEEYHEKELVGQIVVKLKAHLKKLLQYIRKDEIDKIVVNYISTLLQQISLLMETVWRKYHFSPSVFSLKEKGTAHESSMFYTMSRILKAANGMRLPLPPRFHTLHTVLGSKCLPLWTFLHYIDSGVLILTETCVTRLLKDLDNSEKNETLKCSIVARLPEALCQTAYQLWDHPVSSKFYATNYVKRLLEKRWKNQQLYRLSMIEMPTTGVQFLPLNHLVGMLAEVEDQAPNPFEEDTVDSRFVEEMGLKQTRIALGL